MEDSFWELLILSFKQGVIWDACEVNLIYKKVAKDASALEELFGECKQNSIELHIISL
jgi:hypothetical protein